MDTWDTAAAAQGSAGRGQVGRSSGYHLSALARRRARLSEGFSRTGCATELCVRARLVAPDRRTVERKIGTSDRDNGHAGTHLSMVLFQAQRNEPEAQRSGTRRHSPGPRDDHRWKPRIMGNGLRASHRSATQPANEKRCRTSALTKPRADVAYASSCTRLPPPDRRNLPSARAKSGSPLRGDQHASKSNLL